MAKETTSKERLWLVCLGYIDKNLDTDKYNAGRIWQIVMIVFL